MPDHPDGSYRLFAALDLPEEVKNQLHALRPEAGPLARGMRWVRRDGMHVTLHFLGETATDRLALLCGELLRLRPTGVVPLECAGLATLGSPRRPRVLAAGLGGDIERLRLVHNEVGAACRRAGFRLESRQFEPHITLARVRRDASGDVAGALRSLAAEYAATSFGAFTASEAILFRSFLGPDGSVYAPLLRVPLTG